MASNFADSAFEFILQATKRVRMPAGPEPRYSRLAEVQANPEEFVKRFHAGYKDLHWELIGRMLGIEKILRDSKEAADSLTRINLQYHLEQLRRLNDSMAWIMAGRQRHVIKRVCLHRSRTWLREQDLRAALATLKGLNDDSLALAIWTDVTSCVDLGDFMRVCWPNSTPQFIELKTGKVNEAIFNTPLECDRAIHYFAQQHGKKGLKQLQRVLRQKLRAQQIEKLLKDDVGEDPISGKTMRVVETDTPIENYDSMLDRLIHSAEISGESLGVIDDCLWAYVRSRRDIPDSALQEAFLKKLGSMDLGMARDLHKRLDASSVALFSLQDGWKHKTTIPIFLRNISPEAVARIIQGKTIVLLHFDWKQYGVLSARWGAELCWSTEKQGRRESSKPPLERMLVVAGRVPIIKKGDASLHMGGPVLLMTLYDGLTPSSMAQGQIAMLDDTLKSGSNNDGSVST